VGGLSQQAAQRSGVTFVDESSLAEAMAAACREAGRTCTVIGRAGGWPIEGDGLRRRVQDEIVARAERRRGQRPEPAGADGRAPRNGTAAAALERLEPLVIPAPRSSRPGFAFFKRLVRATTAFEVDPVVDHVNALREATVRALEQPARCDGEGPPVSR
jgi:hypothetical protein